MNLLKELEVEIYDQWETGSKIMQSSDGIIRKYSSSLPPLRYLSLLDMWWFTYKVWWWVVKSSVDLVYITRVRCIRCLETLLLKSSHTIHCSLDTSKRVHID